MKRFAFRFVSSVLAMMTFVSMLTAGFHSFAVGPNDINRDGKVDISDVSSMLNALSGYPGEQYDVNRDGSFDISDVSFLLNYLAGEGDLPEEDTIHPFDLAIGDIGLPSGHGYASYTTEKRYANEQGSLKLTVSRSSEVYLTINSPLITDLGDYEYISFRIFNPNGSSVGVGTTWAADTVCAPGQWTEVRVSTSLFGMGKITDREGSSLSAANISGFVIRFIGGYRAGDVFYISAVKGVKKDPSRADVIKAFDLEVGDIGLQRSHGSAVYTAQRAYGNEAGSLLLTVAKDSEVYLGIGTPLIADMTDYDYIAFSVYNPTDGDISVGTLWAADTVCAPGVWTEVQIPTRLFVEGRVRAFDDTPIPVTDISGFVIRFISGFEAGDEFCISSIKGGANDPSDDGVIAAFDKEVGMLNPFNGCASVSHDTTVRFGDEEGSLKVTLNTTGEVYIALTAPEIRNVSDYDYIVFRVFNPNAADIQAGVLWACDTVVKAGEWAEVVVPVSLFAEGSIHNFSAPIPASDITGFSLRLMDLGRLSVGDELYISAVHAEKEPAEPTVVYVPVASFDKEVGMLNPFNGCASVSHDTAVGYGDEEGSLKVTVNTTGEVYIALTAPEITDVTEYDYIVFRVYNPNARDIQAGVLWACDTTLKVGEWTEIIVPVSLFAAGKIHNYSAPIPASDITGFGLRLMDENGLSVGDIYYFSAVYAAAIVMDADKEKNITIGGWDTPINTLEDYLFAREMGLDMLYIDEVYAKRGSQAQAEIFEYCRLAGIDAVMLLGNAGNVEYAQSSWRADRTDYSSFPALTAINYWDEPYYSNLQRLAELADGHLAKYGNSVDFYVNHFPNSATGAFEGLTYDAFIGKYCSDILTKFPAGHRYLSADIYPLEIVDGQNTVRPNWLSCIEVIARNAKQYGADTNFFIQLTEHYDYRKVMEEDIRWQFYVYMAYGIKNFTYFTYRDSLLSGFSDSCVSATESCFPHAQYYWAQKVNGEIHSIGSEYLKYEWYGTMPIIGTANASGSNANYHGLTSPLAEIDCLAGVTAEQDTLIGQLKDGEGNSALVVTNFTDPCRGLDDTVRLEFNNAESLRVFIRGKEYRVEGSTLSLTLGSGEGILVIPA